MRGRWALFLLSMLCARCAVADGDAADAGVRPDAGPAPVWTPVPGIPTEADLFDVWGRSASDIYAVGWNGSVVRFDGTAWSLETTTSTQPLTGVHGAPQPEGATAPGPVFAVGWRGTILERQMDGRWIDADRSEPVAEDLFAVHAGAEDSAVAVGDSGRLVAWDGETWSIVDLLVPGDFTGELIEPKGALKGVWSLDGTRYFITGSGGAAYRTASGVERFRALDTRVSDPLRGIWGTANDNVYTVGLDTLILRFSGGWRRVRDDGAERLPRVFLFDVAGSAEDDITVVGWRGMIARFREGLWEQEPTGTEVDLRAVWIDAETGVAYAVGASGTVLRRDP